MAFVQVSISTLKRICRKHGIAKWPSREMKKVSNAVPQASVQAACSPASELLTGSKTNVYLSDCLYLPLMLELYICDSYLKTVLTMICASGRIISLTIQQTQT